MIERGQQRLDEGIRADEEKQQKKCFEDRGRNISID